MAPPEPPVPVVREAAALRTVPEAELPAAAWRGARLGAVLALALTAPIPFLNPLFFAGLLQLRAFFPANIAWSLWATVLTAGPVALAGLAGALARRRVRAEGARHPDLGRASAAGMCMAAAAVPTGVLAATALALSFGPADIFFNMLGITLGVGVLGAASFGAVPAGRKAEAGKGLPSIYQAFTTAGLAVPVFCATALGWAVLAAVSPVSLAGLVHLLMRLGVGSELARALSLVVGAAPAVYVTGRLARKAFPEAPAGPLAGALAVSVLLPLALSQGHGLAQLLASLPFIAAYLAGCGLVHLPVGALALRGRRPAPGLPGAGDRPRLEAAEPAAGG